MIPTSQNDMLETVKKQARQLQGVLGALGLVSLLISGIGVANTMMMSINERTREVGILKVLGTEFSDIARMFLTEAFLVGLIGGVAGLLVSCPAEAADPEGTGQSGGHGDPLCLHLVADSGQRPVRRRRSPDRSLDPGTESHEHQPERGDPKRVREAEIWETRQRRNKHIGDRPD